VGRVDARPRSRRASFAAELCPQVLDHPGQGRGRTPHDELAGLEFAVGIDVLVRRRKLPAGLLGLPLLNVISGSEQPMAKRLEAMARRLPGAGVDKPAIETISKLDGCR
jgi:hypothetical protein